MPEGAQENIDKAMAMLAGEASVGDGFFQTAVSALALAMGCRAAGISGLSDDGVSVRTLSLAAARDEVLMVRFPLQDMPAESLYAEPSSSPLHIVGDLAERFPKYQALLDFSAYRYSAALYYHADGSPAGHIFILDEEEVERGEEARAFFDLICKRVGAEYSLRGGFAEVDWMDALVDETNTGLVVTDVAGHIVQANKTYALWSGVDTGTEIVGSNVRDWISPAAWAANEQAVAELVRTGVAQEYESELIDRSGHRRQVAVIASRQRTPAGIRFVALVRDIKKRKLAEKARLESEARFRNLIEGSLEAVLIADAQMRSLFVNPAAATIFGYSGPDEIIALGGNKPLVAPHEMPGILAWRQQILAGDEADIEREVEGRRKDGSPVWLRVMARLIDWDGQPAVQSTMLDITERHRADQERAEIDARFHAILDNVPVSMAQKDLDGRYLLINKCMERRIGLGLERLRGKTIHEVLGSESAAEVVKLEKEVLRSGIPDTREEISPYDGTAEIMHTTRFPIFDGNGQVTGTGAISLDITEQRQAEGALRESEAHLRAVFDNAPVSIALKDMQGRYLLVNKSTEEWTGLSNDEMRGRTVHEIRQTPESANAHSTDMEVLQTGKVITVEDASAYGRPENTKFTVRFPVVDKDGKVAGMGAMSQDITEQRQAEMALRESEARLEAVIENAPLSIILKDAEGRYATMNRQAEDWTGTTLAEAAGNLPDALFSADLAKSERNRDLEVLNYGRIISYEIKGEGDYSGHTFWVTKFPILGQDGGSAGLGTITSDITERKQSEQVLLRQMEKAEQSSDAKTRFLAAASHDLRQPLHSMELMLEILARQLNDPGQQELVADIAQAANIAAGLLNPLLDFSRLEAGMEEPEINEFPVASLLRDMEVGFRSQAEAADLELRIMPCSATIRSDPVLLSRIVSNFLSNAIRYTEEGRVLVGCRRVGGVLRIEVWDMGPGIDGAHLNSIFEEFHQVESTKRDRDQGLGLGLAIVKAQATLLNHEVRVRSRPGRGSTFAIEVPMTRRTDSVDGAAVTTAADSACVT
ncbi:MAG: PAS domain S-box protein [Alphaproteobacteria bacterium]|nr:PAS domain S-box protein [Alphaproteobacteria bacterium]